MAAHRARDYARFFKRHFPLAPKKAALLVIDMQYATASSTAGLGSILSSGGRDAATLWRFSRIENTVVPNLQRLLPCFRSLGIPVIYITMGSERQDYSDVAPHLKGLVAETGNRVGEANHNILTDLAPQDEDPIVNKKTASPFWSSDLHRMLQALSVGQLLLAGVSTNACVEGTGRDAVDLGYECIVVDDCCSAATPEIHQRSLSNFARFMGEVMCTTSILEQLSEFESE